MPRIGEGAAYTRFKGVPGVAAISDTTAPTVSNPSLSEDGSNNIDFSFDTDEQLGGNTPAIKVTVDGPNSGADIYTFYREDFSETDNGDGTFTYNLSKTQAYDDGDGQYTAAVDDAIDPAGNDGADGTDTASFTIDVTAPDVLSANLNNPTGEEAEFVVTTDEQLGTAQEDLFVDFLDPNGDRIVTWNRDGFDETDNGDGTWTYVDNGDWLFQYGEGTYKIVVIQARDPAGNDGANNEEGSFTFTEPTVSSVSLSNDGFDNLDFSFDTDKQVGGNASDILVTVDGPTSGADVYSFDRTDFSETANNDGSFTYDLTTTQPYGDGDGTYTAAVDDAIDSEGHDGADGTQTDSHNFSPSTDGVAGYTIEA